MSTINFVPSADASVVSEFTKGILRGVLDDAGLGSCVITSTVRTPAAQARAMFVNIEATGIQKQMGLYGPFGQQVIRIYAQLKPQGLARQAIIDAMEKKIRAVGPDSVSRHCADPKVLNVVDIAPSSIADATGFLAALARAKTARTVSKFFSPLNGDPAFHVEVPQPAP